MAAGEVVTIGVDRMEALWESWMDDGCGYTHMIHMSSDLGFDEHVMPRYGI